MTWEQVQRRNRVVRAVVDRAADGPPSPTAHERAAIAEEFTDLPDFLLAVHALWARAFDARLDATLENGSDPRAGVAGICDGLARDLPGAQRILDEHADEPVLTGAVSRHDRRLLDATGVDRREVAAPATYQSQPVSGCSVRRSLRAVRASLSPAR